MGQKSIFRPTAKRPAAHQEGIQPPITAGLLHDRRADHAQLAEAVFEADRIQAKRWIGQLCPDLTFAIAPRGEVELIGPLRQLGKSRYAITVWPRNRHLHAKRTVKLAQIARGSR